MNRERINYGDSDTVFSSTNCINCPVLFKSVVIHPHNDRLAHIIGHESRKKDYKEIRPTNEPKFVYALNQSHAHHYIITATIRTL